ncbi:MAG: hypothetical protein IKD53_01560 [Clostridia bacterium]|nr:hypothetical protein [Clostridia bacterium]
MANLNDNRAGAAAARKNVVRTVTYVLLAFWAIMVLFPYYWMLLTSVKSFSAYSSEYVPKFFTLAPTLQNYRDAFSMARWAGIS